MAKLTRRDREEIAHRRIINVLKSHGVASARTLEQKISDAGPSPQRIDPHILTPVRNRMVQAGRLVIEQRENIGWYRLAETPSPVVKSRLDEQAPVLRALNNGGLRIRMGQTLEISTYKALLEIQQDFFGGFSDLDDHEDNIKYIKEEPPRRIRNRCLPNKQNLDFIVHHHSAGYLGVECKNVREWLYPDSNEIKETLNKCIILDCVPVIIARRLPFVTFSLLNTCGVIIHQTYNQLYPSSEEELTNKARHKTNLGYHDIRTGNNPDKRLVKFITENMISVAEESRTKFEYYKDVLTQFASNRISQSDFGRIVVARRQGLDEFNPFEPDPADWDFVEDR